MPNTGPSLSIEPDPRGGGWCVVARGLDPRRACRPGAPSLRVEVVGAACPGEDLPGVAGTCEAAGDVIRFTPHLPFRRGLAYRAVLRPADPRDARAVLTREFSCPSSAPEEVARVVAIHPSGDLLPENLLRFYVRFSAPMRRGAARDSIAILDRDGSPVPDALYRAPVELWDRSMTCLTVLLDPGRLKRGVGPNRALGPPLRAGRRYALEVGAGMVDAGGRRLRSGCRKPFAASDAIREPIAAEAWAVRAPPAGTREPLELAFPRPLDWALLRRGIAVALADGTPVDGRIDVEDGGGRWRLTPGTPWQAGAYRIHPAPTLEDLCGNTPLAPFDGPRRDADGAGGGAVAPSIALTVQAA